MRRLVLALGLSLAACGSPAPSVSAAPLPSATAAARPAPAKRGPSAAVARAFAVASPKLAAYVDVDGLARTKLVSGLLPELVAMAKGKTDAATARCLDVLPKTLEEAAVGSNVEGWLLVARYDARSAAARACFDALAPKDAAVATAAPGVVAVGTPELVERAARGGGEAPSGLALGANEYARFTYDEKPMRVSGSVALSDTRFALRADADLPEELARALAENFQKQTVILSSAPNPDVTDDQRKTVEHLAHASTLTRNGSHLAYRFVLDEGAVDQARDLGAISALAIAGVRKYLLRSKEAEATSTLRVLARAIAASWEQEQVPRVPRKKRRLRSFPPVPAKVPSGVPWQSTPADWAAWAPLKFEMDEPQRYQYEVRAARDGMSADVIARGDLNGDGKTSLFVIHVTVDKADRTLKLSDLAVTDPDE